jgi:hypothetical protein
MFSSWLVEGRFARGEIRVALMDELRFSGKWHPARANAAWFDII